MELDWQVDVVPNLVGGRVIVSSKITPFPTFHEIRQRCYDHGNKAFEILFLAPPGLLTKEPKGGREFKMLKEFGEHGFQLWDGACEDLRSIAPLKIDQHRLLQ